MCFIWVKVDSCGKNVVDAAKNSSTAVLILTFPHVWISMTWSTNHACECQKQDSFILHDSFVLSNFESIYLKSLQPGS